MVAFLEGLTAGSNLINNARLTKIAQQQANINQQDVDQQEKARQVATFGENLKKAVEAAQQLTQQAHLENKPDAIPIIANNLKKTLTPTARLLNIDPALVERIIDGAVSGPSPKQVNQMTEQKSFSEQKGKTEASREQFGPVTTIPGVDPQAKFQKNLQTGQFKDVFKPATALVNNTITSEREFDKQRAKGDAGRVNKIFDEADKAVFAIDQVNQLEALADQWEQSGGQFSRISPALKSASEWLGSVGVSKELLGKLKLPTNAGVGQAIERLANEMALAKIGSEGLPANNFSDADREFLLKTVPQLSNTPEGFRLILKMHKKLKERLLEKEEFYDNYEDSPRGAHDFRRDWKKFATKTDVITKEDIEEINQQIQRNKIIAAQPKTMPIGSNPVRVNSEQEAMQLPVGTLFELIDPITGRVRQGFKGQ